MHYAGGQSIGTGVVSLNMDTVDIDPSSMCTTGTPGFITIPVDGIYIVISGVSFNNSGGTSNNWYNISNDIPGSLQVNSAWVTPAGSFIAGSYIDFFALTAGTVVHAQSKVSSNAINNNGAWLGAALLRQR